MSQSRGILLYIFPEALQIIKLLTSVRDEAMEQEVRASFTACFDVTPAEQQRLQE